MATFAARVATGPNGLFRQTQGQQIWVVLEAAAAQPRPFSTANALL
jgi:hypothetical protein